MEDKVLEFLIGVIQGLQGNPWSPLAFVAIYAGACFAMPLSLFPVAGGILFGFWGGMACNLTAALLGASGPFFVARRLGRERVRRFVSGHGSPAVVSLMTHHGFAAFLTVRLVGFPPFVVANYLAGLSGMSFRIFLAATVLGVIPWTVLMTYFADTLWGVLLSAGANGFRAAVFSRVKPLVVLGVLCAAVGAGALWLARRRVKEGEAGKGSEG